MYSSQTPSCPGTPPFSPYDIPEPFRPLVGQLIVELKDFFTEKRLQTFARLSQNRSQGVLCVFESTHHCHNISAVLRTMDALGFQDGIFLYEEAPMKFRFQDSVDRGSALWLTLRRSSNRESVARFLESLGYHILLVTAPQFFETGALHPPSLPHISLENMPLANRGPVSAPIALIFGNERNGIHPQWFALAHGSLGVPMSGFTESLNLSVCAGIVLYQLKALGYGHLIDPKSCSLLQDLWASRETPRAVIDRFLPKFTNYFKYLLEGGFFCPPLE